MRIHDANTSTPMTRTANGLTAGKSKGSAQTDETGAAAKSDATTVTLSAKAQALASGSARIEELKSKIQNGTYKVDAQAIANKLVGDE